MEKMIAPDWQSNDGTIQLYCGDCLDILPTFADGAVDAVVTDPPYGIEFKYESHDDTSEGYGDWLWRVMLLCESSCSPGSPIFVWQAMPNCRYFSTWFPRDYRIFAACKNFVQMRPTAMQYAFDPTIVWWTEGDKWSSGTLSRDFHVADTSPSTRKKNSLNYVEGHPCPRPLLQVRHIIEQWVKPDSICLDPFMGSGTTGVACASTGRKFIGIEKEPKYFDIAVKRIQDALHEGNGDLLDMSSR